MRAAVVLLGVCILGSPAFSQAQEPMKPSAPAKPVAPEEPEEVVEAPSGPPVPVFGSQIGAQFKTITGTIPTFQLYVIPPGSSTFRWGGFGFVSAGSDLREFSLSALVGIRVGLGGTFAAMPYAGFGFVYSTWDALGNSTFSSTSFGPYVPLGLTLEMDFGGNLFTITGMVNFHKLDFTDPTGQDDGSASLLFGVAM
jgi:hypothetical protein